VKPLYIVLKALYSKFAGGKYRLTVDGCSVIYDARCSMYPSKSEDRGQRSDAEQFVEASMNQTVQKFYTQK
jgi:hypothetical protein